MNSWSLIVSLSSALLSLVLLLLSLLIEKVGENLWKKYVCHLYLVAINFHDQRPSSPAACCEAMTCHVAVYRNTSRGHLQQIRAVSFTSAVKQNLGCLKSFG